MNSAASPTCSNYLIKIGAPQVGVCIDTAWCLQIGPWLGKPLEWAKRYAGHIYGIHFKDFTFDRNGQWNDVVVGTGNLDLPGFLKELQTGKFDGMAVIEYEAEPANPVPRAPRAASRAMRQSAKA
ncbi:MAG: sugar phosphate isomerase/epimerase [Verrucomicrobiota bacterium]